MKKKLSWRQNFSFQICTKLLSTRFLASTVTSIELASSYARVTSIKFTKQEWVSWWVSQWQGKTKIGLGSDKKKHTEEPQQEVEEHVKKQHLKDSDWRRDLEASKEGTENEDVKLNFQNYIIEAERCEILPPVEI